MPQLPFGVLAIILVVIFILYNGIKILNEYERAVIFRLGRVSKAVLGGNGPGIILVIPIIDRVVKVSLRLVTMDVPSQDIITKDNVTIKVNAVVYFRVMESTKAIIEIENYVFATSQLAQTTLRSILGAVELDDLLSKREKINNELQDILDRQTDPWGVKVTAVEIKHVDLPQEMQRSMAKQAEAEREKRAKIIHAEGELAASHKIAEAAEIIGKNPVGLQLRYLQTLTEVAVENNSTTIFPIPLDLIKPFLEKLEGGKEEKKEKSLS
jgi:regulator of protease activity HflC (stomatin/prohibitin superfamily)